MSDEYMGPDAHVLQQSFKSALYPGSDMTESLA